MELKLPIIDGGLNIADLEHKIEDNQSPNMLNLWYKDRTLTKRWGQDYITLTASGSPVTLGTIHGISKEFEGYSCIHAGTKLYKWNTSTNEITELGTVAGAEGVFMEFNGYLYFLDGTEIWQINSSWGLSAVTPYVPIVYINCTPTLTASTANEAYNLIGAGFNVWYNGNGTGTYNLPLTSLDATEIIVKVGGVTKAKTTDYTWAASTGIVTFVSGHEPAAGTNNVVITAYKTITGAKAKIAMCKIAIPFGGESGDIEGGTRAFLMKNASYPRTYWYSDLGASQSYGMSYFPDTQYEELTQNNDKITAAAKQAGKLIIFKENSLFSIDYNFDGEEVYYPVTEFNSTIGCDIPKSVQLIDNNLVFANTTGGVFMIVNMSGNAEENVRPISLNINGTRINPGLLDEANLVNATSIDYDRKYWLCVNGNVYLWDYDITPFYGYSSRYTQTAKKLSWFKFDNIYASYWYGGDELYYGYLNKIIKFKDILNDFSSTIKAHWTSKSFDFNAPNYLKTILKVFPSMRADTNSSMTISVINENKVSFYSKVIDVECFNWATFSWDTFSWNVQRFSKPYKLKPRMKKVVYCQIKVEGNEVNRDMGITDLVIEFITTGKVKK